MSQLAQAQSRRVCRCRLEQAVHAVVTFDQQLPIQVSPYRKPFTGAEHRAAQRNRAHVDGPALLVGIHERFAALGMRLDVDAHLNGQLLIESDDGVYRLFEPTPANPSRLRLSQLGDRNDNRIYLDYDDAGRLVRLRDTFDLVQVELIRDQGHVTHIERLYPDQHRELLVSYSYDAEGNLAQVRDATGQVQRRFAYDAGRRMVEHQLPTGLRCFYEWALVEGLEWRVVRHWTDEGDAYQFDYDLQAGLTRITDGLQRVSTRHWNTQYQIIQYSDKLGQTWLFEWNDERQLLSATDPQGGRFEYSYDESGNLIGETDPLGRSDSTLWLEHWALPLVETDAASISMYASPDPRATGLGGVEHGRSVCKRTC